MNDRIFEDRRRAVRERMGEGALVLFAAPLATRNSDVEHPYRQDSDFYYLTGIEDPNCALLLSTTPGSEFVLFVTEQDPAHTQWDGPKLTLAQAKEVHGANQAFAMSALDKHLAELLKGHERAFFPLGKHSDNDLKFIAALTRSRALARRTGRAPKELRDVTDVLHELRRIKSPHEIETMRRANDVSKRAHLKAMAFARPGAYEYQLRAVLEHEFTLNGALRPAYESIVGSGPNATTLHYIKNTRQMQEGDLVLIDAGCELDYYASDITRTFPANGKFTEAQRRIYELVLDAQLQCIAAAKPGATFGDLHSIALRVITQGLIDLGFISGPVEEAIEEKRHQPYFMHKTGHYLGMDVHDVGAYRQGERARPFDSGVVITIEPGLYISQDNESVPKEFRGIGVRIEDDVLITDNGYENLTEGLAKTVDAIETACAV